VSGVSLRPVKDADLDALSGQMRDPESVWMAAFTARDPDDRAALDARMARLRRSPDITLRAVTCDGRLAGSIASFVIDGRTEITYWIERASCGQGIASMAAAQFLRLGARPAAIRSCRQRQCRLAPRPS
jgi:RimJ/RimL family protein N-acetyltransferase